MAEAKTAGRSFVRIWRDITGDADYRRLTPEAKLTYLTLLHQPEVTQCGLLSISVKRWATEIGWTPERLWEQLLALDAARFIVLDDDFDELLIRTRMKNDALVRGGGSWKTHKGVLNSALRVHSPRLRRAVFDELCRSFEMLSPDVYEYADSVLQQLSPDTYMELFTDEGIEVGIEADIEATGDPKPEIADQGPEILESASHHLRGFQGVATNSSADSRGALRAERPT